MSVRVSCPGCQAPYVLPDEQRGKQLRCSKCQQVFAVPGARAGGNGAGEERLQPRPGRAGPAAAVAPAPAKAERKGGGVPCVLAVLAVLVALCAGAGLGGGGVFLAMLLTVKTSTTTLGGPVAVGVPAKPEAPAPQPAPPAAEPVRPAPNPAAEPARPPQPEPVAPQAEPPPAEPVKLPLKATVGRPYRAYLPGRQPQALYVLTDGPPGIALTARGEVQWTPGKDMVGTREFTVRVTDGGPPTTRRYQLEVQEDMAPVAGRPDVPGPGGVPMPGGAADGLLRDQATIPEKATAGKPFTYRFPNPGGTVKYELLPQWKQNNPGLDVTPEGVLTWTPPVGTPARPFQLLMMVGGRLKTYFLEIQEDTATTLALPAPGGWVMLPDGVTLIVSQPDKAQLVYVDTAAVKETKRVTLEFKPGPLAFQGDKLFAAAQGSGLLYVLDLMTGEVKKEIKASDAPILALACHPKQGLVYASNGQNQVRAVDPAGDEVTDTGARGMFLAVDPVNGDAVYTGIQGRIRDVIEFQDAGGGRFTLAPGRRGEYAVLLKYAVKGNTLTPVSANDNAASNGRLLRVSPDGKKVGIPGGGGYRPRSGGAGKGYGVALFGTDDVKTLLGVVECGAYPQNLAFHPDLDLGVVDQGGSTLHLFNSKSLVEVGTIPFAPEPPAPGPRSDLLTFGARGTKLIYHDTHGGAGNLRFLPLQLTDKDKEALEKKYGKAP